MTHRLLYANRSNYTSTCNACGKFASFYFIEDCFRTIILLRIFKVELNEYTGTVLPLLDPYVVVEVTLEVALHPLFALFLFEVWDAMEEVCLREHIKIKKRIPYNNTFVYLQEVI